MAEEEKVKKRVKRTAGTPNTPIGAKAFFKPSIGRLVMRKPGVLRKSEKVLKINAQLEAVKGTPDAPASKCEGKPWKEFVSCLRKEMKALIKKVEEK